MNKLVDSHYTLLEPSSESPYRLYSRGDRVRASPAGELANIFVNYYPRSRRFSIIEKVLDNRYIIHPEGYNDKLNVSHWDLRPVQDLVESKLYAPISCLLPGVSIRSRDNSIKMVMERRGDRVLCDDGCLIRKDTPVNIVRWRDDSTSLSAFLRK